MNFSPQTSIQVHCQWGTWTVAPNFNFASEVLLEQLRIEAADGSAP